MGAYLGLVTPGVPILGAFMFNAIYKFPAYRFTCTNVFTNKTWTDAYRGAGRPEATFAIERMMDTSPHELGMDPLDVREKNWITHEEFPFTTVAGLTYDSGNYEAATGTGAWSCSTTRGCGASRPSGGAARTRSSSASGSRPSPRCAGSRRRACSARCRYVRRRLGDTPAIRMLPTGKVEVVTGASAHGQGHETAWSQIVADQLGVPFEDVEVLHGDTQIAAAGPGHLRVAVAGGRRHRHGQGRREGHREGQGPSRPTCSRPASTTSSSPTGSSRSRAPTGAWRIAEVAFAVVRRAQPARRRGAEHRREATFDPENFSFPHGTHLCAVEVDTETGQDDDPLVRLRRRHRHGASTR